jgi:hypothetical protein
MKNEKISDFILDIGKKIEEVSGAKLNFPQEATVPEEKWIPQRQEKEMLLNKGIELRTEEQTQNLDVVELKKFDPYCRQGNSLIPCRMPGCLETFETTCTPKRRTKQDLFLCKAHRAKWTDLVSKRCAKENITLNLTIFKEDDLKGYTSLIGGLEKAFMHLKSKGFARKTTTDSLLAEVFLNTRNFLIVTNALLNPDIDNILAVLAPYLQMLRRFLAFALENPAKLLVGVTLLREIMFAVLIFYGITYQWVSWANPGARSGSGVGILLAFLASVLVYIFGGEIGFLGKIQLYLVFTVAGYLIGSGAYDWYRDPGSEGRRQQQASRSALQFMIQLIVALSPRNYIGSFDAIGPQWFRVRADNAGNVSVDVPPEEPQY